MNNLERMMSRFKNLTQTLRDDLDHRYIYQKNKYIKGRYDMMADLLEDIQDIIGDYQDGSSKDRSERQTNVL